MPRPKKKVENPAEAPPFAAQATMTAGEEQLDATPENEIADAVREVALAFRDLSETLAKIFLAGPKPTAQVVVATPVTTTTQPAQVLQPQQQVAPVAPSAPVAPPTAPTPAAMPQQPAPAEGAHVFSQQDLAWLVQAFQSFKARGFSGTQTTAPQMIGKIRESLPHLTDEAIWAMVRQVEAMGYANPAHALIQLTPPVPGTQTPSLITIL